MAEIIDLQKVLQKRKLEKVKKALDNELNRIDYDMEKELNKYVIPDVSEYYNISKEDSEVSEHNVTNILLTALDMLIELNKQQAVSDVENIITRLKNNSY
tara:strand:- start:1057 stop:1356 length:300 start_codon:yes stop_codon:yes gene_type:complete